MIKAPPPLVTGLLLLSLLVLQEGTAVDSLKVKSATNDEPTHLSYGTRAVQQGTFLRVDSGHDATMPVSALNAWSAEVGRKRLLERGEEPGQHDLLFYGRLPTVALALLLTLLVFSWARELFGTWAGLFAAALCSLSPNVLAHGRLITTDVPLTLGMFAATYTFWRYLRAPSWGRLVVAALAFGAAQLTKVTAVFLIPVFLLILAFRAWGHRRQGAGGRRLLVENVRALGALSALCLGAVVVVNAGFFFEGTFTPLADVEMRSERFQELQRMPGLGTLPLPAPVPYVQGWDLVFRDMGRDRWTYCLGRYNEQGVWYYYLLAFLLKVPPAFLLLLSLAAVVAFRAPKTGTEAGEERAGHSWGNEAFLLVPVLFLLVYLSFFFQYQIGLRHFLPAFPFLYVSVARVVPWARGAWLKKASIGLLLMAYAGSSFGIHPHYLAYFNFLGGGPEEGWRYFIDSNLDWGQDRAAARHGYPKRSEKPVVEDPRAPMAGRILVSVNSLVGLKPHQAEDYRWLREGDFEPVETIGYSWHVYDVSREDLEQCCADLFVPLEPAEGNLATRARPFGGGERGKVFRLKRLTDGSLGAGAPADAAIVGPEVRRPFAAWFGLEWDEEVEVGRLLAYPTLAIKGPRQQRLMAREVVAETWDGTEWREIPGTRRSVGEDPEVDLRFAPVRTKRIRLKVVSTRNHRGLAVPHGRFQVACLELAAYGPEPGPSPREAGE